MHRSRSIANAHNDTGCPKGALGRHRIHHRGGRLATDFTAAAAPCDPLLHVWNSGQGKLTFFFVDQAPNHLCLARRLKTGRRRPLPGDLQDSGKNWCSTCRFPPT